MNKVLLPELGEGITKATVACWYVRCGDSVQEGDDLVELVTDKATFNVSATITGRVRKILAEKGQDVKIGSALAVID